MTPTVILLNSEAQAEIKAKRDALWDSLPPFNLEKALAGELYVTRYDLIKKRAFCDVRRIEEPNAGYLIWAGEWLPYTFDEEAAMRDFFRMYKPGIFGGAA